MIFVNIIRGFWKNNMQFLRGTNQSIIVTQLPGLQKLYRKDAQSYMRFAERLLNMVHNT